MTVRNFTAISRWITFTDFGDLGFGTSCEPTTNFDDAVDAYVGAMDEGNDSQVWRLDFSTNQMEDVTAEAIAKAYGWNAVRGTVPGWLEAVA